MSEFKKNIVWLFVFGLVATMQILLGLTILSYWPNAQALGGSIIYGTYATFFIPFILRL